MKYNVTRWMLTDSLNTRSFSWTSDSRLAPLTAGLPTGNETYTYSPFGTRTFLRAGAGVTASVLTDGNASYTPGVSENRSSVTTYSHSGLKHMGAQSDAGATPAVQATRTYDAFGAVQGSTGAWQGPFGTAGAFGYQTEGSGLHLLGHRYYDPSTGRFLSRDPVGDGSNWYAYCGSNPIRFFDPSGLVRITVYWTYVAGGGYHIGILIEDNVKGSKTYGRRYLFNAGPGQAFSLIGGWGHLIGRSGPERGNADEHGSDGGKKRWAGSMVLLDDDSAWAPWIGRALDIEAEMSEVPIVYSPVPGFPYEGNSNSWATKLIEGLGLRDEWDEAMKRRRKKKREEFWTPGAWHDPWGDGK